MSRCSRWLTVAILLALVSAVGADEKPAPITAVKTWNGIVAIKFAPRNGYVGDKESWEGLWKTHRGVEKVPDVDFSKELVLVAVNSDPNGISIDAKLDEKGDLKVTHVTTTIAFNNPTTCSYQFMVIKRAGIKSINGNAVIAAPAK